MAIAKHTADAIIQDLTEYARRRWPVTHELMELTIDGRDVIFRPMINDEDSWCYFDKYDPENTPSAILENDRMHGIKRDEHGIIPDCCLFMDYVENNMNRFYQQRQPDRQKINIPTASSRYDLLQSWFELDMFSVVVVSIDEDTLAWTYRGRVDKALSVLENILRKYEEYRQVVADIMRVLPLPIGRTILKQM